MMFIEIKLNSMKISFGGIQLTTQAIDKPVTLDNVRNWDKATIDTTEAARLLGVDRRTILKGIESGDIPAIKLGRKILIPRERFLELFN